MTIEQILESKTIGEVIDINNISSSFNQLAKLCHPDVCKHAKAAEAFLKIKKARELAESGKPADTQFIASIKFITKKNTYEVIKTLQNKGFFTIFLAQINEKLCLIKVPKDRADNDLIINEREVIKKIFAENQESAGKLVNYHFPKLLDFFKHDNKEINVFSFDEKLTSLKELTDIYELNLKTIAWLWRRILISLELLNKKGLCHLNIIPTNLFIDVEGHRVVLYDFSAAAKVGEKPKYIEKEYKDWYSVELLTKKKAKINYDLAASTKVFEFTEEKLNLRAQKLLLACKSNLLNNPLDIHDEFGMMLKQMFGEPKFHKFPGKKKK